MPQEDNISKLHKYLTKNYKGFTLDSATFRQDIQDENNLHRVWESVGKSNTDFTVDWDTFKSDIVGETTPISPLPEEQLLSESDTDLESEQPPEEKLGLIQRIKEFGRGLSESLGKQRGGAFIQPFVPDIAAEEEEEAAPEISPEQLEEEIPEGSWERGFYDRSEQMKQHATDLGVDEATYEVADVLHSLQNSLPGEPDEEVETGYLGGTVNSLYKAMGRTLHEWQNLAEVVDDGTGNILSITKQLQNPEDPRNKRLLEINKAWREADTEEEKEEHAREYRKFRRETSPLTIIADWVEGKAAEGFKEMPEGMGGEILTGLAGIVPLVGEILLTPGARFYGAGARFLGAAKPLITNVPKLMTLEGFKGFGRGWEESVEEEYTGAKAIITPYKELGVGAMYGMYMHSIGVGASKLGKFFTELGLGKDALTKTGGQIMYAGSSATFTGAGFGTLGAQQYYAENVGKISPEELRAGMKKRFGIDFGIGFGLGLPAVGRIAGTSGIDKLMRAAYKKGFQNFYSATPELIRAINMAKIDPFKLRGEVEKLGEKIIKEKAPERRKELEVLMTAKNNQLEINAITQDVIMNPEKHIANIKKSPLKESVKKELIDKVNRVTAENDPLIQAIKPFDKESRKLQAKREVIEQNDKLSPKAKEVKLKEIIEKEKKIQEKIDIATAEFRKEPKKVKEVPKEPSKEVSPEKEAKVPKKKEKPLEKPVEKKEVKTEVKKEEKYLADMEYIEGRKQAGEKLLTAIEKTREKLPEGGEVVFEHPVRQWRGKIIKKEARLNKEYREVVTKEDLIEHEKEVKKDLIIAEQRLKKLKEVKDAVQKPETKEVPVGEQAKVGKEVDKEIREPDKKEPVKEVGKKELKGLDIRKSVGAAIEGFSKKAAKELKDLNILFSGGKFTQKERPDKTIKLGIQKKTPQQEKRRIDVMRSILKSVIKDNEAVLKRIHGRAVPAIMRKLEDAKTARTMNRAIDYIEKVVTDKKAREELIAQGDAINKIEKEISKKALEEQRITLKKAKGTLKSSISPEYIDLLERVRHQIKEGDPIYAEEAREKTMDAIEGRDTPLTVAERQKLQELDFAHIHEMSSLEVEQKLKWVKDIKKGMRSAAQSEKAERAEKWGSRVIKGLTELIPKGKKLLTGSAARSIKKKLHKGFDFIWDSSWQSLLNKMSIYRPGKEMPGKEWLNETFYRKTIKLAEDAEIIGQEWHKEYKLKIYEKAFGLKGSKLKNKMDIEGSKEGYAPVEFINEKGELQKEYLSQRTAAQKWLEYRNPDLQEKFHLPVEEGGMGWTEKTVEQLEAYLKPEWKTLANEIAKSYEMLYDRYNSAHQKAFGINMAKTEHFVPIYTSNNRALPSEVLADGMLEQPLSQIMNTRHMKRRVSHKNPLAFVDILDVYNTYFTRMEKFRNWHEPVNELKHFFKDPKIKEAIRQFHGSEYNKITDWFIKRFEGVDDVWMKSEFEKGLDRWTTNVTKGILYANRSVGIKQAISTVMYLTDMPVHQWVYGIGESLTRLRKTSKEFEEGAFLKGRSRAYFDIDNVAKAKIRKNEFGRFLNTIHVDKMDSFLGANIRIGDRIPMYTGGYAYYRYKKKGYKRQHPDWSEEKIHKEAFDDFEFMSERTQQSLRTSNISYLRGTHATWRTISMFTSGAGQIHRISASAVREIGQGRNVLKNMRTLAVSHVLMGQLFTLIGNNLEWDWKEQKFAVVLGNAKGMAVMGKLFSSASNALLKKPWARGLGEEMSTVVGLIDDIGASLLKINNLAKEKGVKPGDTYKYAEFMRDEEVKKAFKKLIMSLAVARGIPANELEDIYISGKKIGRGETEHPILEGFGLDSDYSDEPKIWEPGGFILREKNK